MSLAERAKESLLLKERWNLIQAGYDNQTQQQFPLC